MEHPAIKQLSRWASLDLNVWSLGALTRHGSQGTGIFKVEECGRLNLLHRAQHQQANRTLILLARSTFIQE
jgi:hypothetical protein